MSLPKIHPNYYAVIPASVRYDRNLTPAAKLLYGEIAALCNQEGFCWASNRYFAGLYDTTPRSIQNWLNDLEGAGHITSDYTEATSGTARNIYLTEAHEKNVMGGVKKSSSPHEKSFTHNNTTNITKNKDTSSSSAEATDSQESKDVREIYQLYLKCFKVPSLRETYGNETDQQLLDRAEKRYKLTDKRRKAIKVRLKDAGKKMLMAAVIGYSRQVNFEGRRHWAGDNDNGWVADLADFICRGYEQVEKGANFFESQIKTKNMNDPWSQ